MKKLCYLATIPAVVHAFLREQIQAASQYYEVTVVCNSADAYLLEGLNARIVLLPIERKPSPWRDFWMLLRLFFLFRTERFDIVHTHMPKTGLLGMMAAWGAGIPARVHTFHGEVWATRKGLPRRILMLLDRLVASLATNILAVSPSQRDFLVAERVLSLGKATVIGAGSICGVDPLRFCPQPDTRKLVREELKLSQDARIILFVGRLNRDKGMLDLAAAFNQIVGARKDLALLLVGAEEDTPFTQIQSVCSAARERLRYVKFTSSPQRYMAAADVFCLPSYREGLPMTIIEAAACGVPSVASKIYGVTDAVVDGETGLLFQAGDVDGLIRCLSRLIDDVPLRKQMGQAARQHAISNFSNVKITQNMMALYAKLSGQD